MCVCVCVSAPEPDRSRQTKLHTLYIRYTVTRGYLYNLAIPPSRAVDRPHRSLAVLLIGMPGSPRNAEDSRPAPEPNGGSAAEQPTSDAAPAEAPAEAPATESPAAFSFTFNLTPNSKTAGTLVPVVPMVASGSTPTSAVASKTGGSSRKIGRKQQADDMETVSRADEGDGEEEGEEGETEPGVPPAQAVGFSGLALSDGFDLSKFKLEIQAVEASGAST